MRHQILRGEAAFDRTAEVQALVTQGASNTISILSALSIQHRIDRRKTLRIFGLQVDVK